MPIRADQSAPAAVRMILVKAIIVLVIGFCHELMTFTSGRKDLDTHKQPSRKVPGYHTIEETFLKALDLEEHFKMSLAQNTGDHKHRWRRKQTGYG
jgi:hypothetical protein